MLPNDINILVSVVNMKLRDFYSSFDEMCDGEDEDKNQLLSKLNEAGWKYSEERNRFER